MGDILSTMGMFSTMGDVQYRGGYLEYRGGVQCREGISLSTIGVFSAVRGYH